LKIQVFESSEFVFYPNSRSVFAQLGMSLHVLFLPLSGSGWSTSSSSPSLLLLLLEGECTGMRDRMYDSGPIRL
jgi:hypothetical protein